MIGVIKLATSPAGKWVGVILSVLTFIAWQRHDAASDARIEAENDCRVEVSARTKQEIKRQQAVQKQVLAKATDRQAASAEENQRFREMADESTTRLRETGATCPLDDDFLKLLRDIR